MNQNLEPLLTMAPVIPVLTIDDLDTSLPLARALVTGGLPLLEITLRTPRALDAIEAIGKEIEGAIVGAGTVLNAAQFAEAGRRGARFAVSPGVTDRLLAAAKDTSLPLLPGAATASEVMRLLDHGCRFMKFFPAEPAGGLGYLKALAAPLPEARFCPTGGIGPDKARAYLSLANVVCVGGSWIAPGEAVRAGDWTRIQDFARQAVGLGAR